MTKITLHKNTVHSLFTKMSYKTFILFYSFYMVFSSQVFALQADAPEGGTSFTEVAIDDSFSQEESNIDTRIQKIESYYNRHNLPLAENTKKKEKLYFFTHPMNRVCFFATV